MKTLLFILLLTGGCAKKEDKKDLFSLFQKESGSFSVGWEKFEDSEIDSKTLMDRYIKPFAEKMKVEAEGLKSVYIQNYNGFVLSLYPDGKFAAQVPNVLSVSTLAVFPDGRLVTKTDDNELTIETDGKVNVVLPDGKQFSFGSSKIDNIDDFISLGDQGVSEVLKDEAKPVQAVVVKEAAKPVQAVVLEKDLFSLFKREGQSMIGALKKFVQAKIDSKTVIDSYTKPFAEKMKVEAEGLKSVSIQHVEGFVFSLYPDGQFVSKKTDDGTTITVFPDGRLVSKTGGEGFIIETDGNIKRVFPGGGEFSTGPGLLLF